MATNKNEIIKKTSIQTNYKKKRTKTHIGNKNNKTYMLQEPDQNKLLRLRKKLSFERAPAKQNEKKKGKNVLKRGIWVLGNEEFCEFCYLKNGSKC